MDEENPLAQKQIKQPQCCILVSLPITTQLQLCCVQTLSWDDFPQMLCALWILGTFNKNDEFGDILDHVSPHSCNELLSSIMEN